ncbi:glycosyltransferase family 25 protein [Malikia sp.]|uniref:glycosyltransferase family 25 protein n=1 Tax=Malikia sp. TaxID=2070706 RepID=UPI00345CCCDE
MSRLNPHPAPHGEWFRRLTAGELGCFLSHLRCWQLLVERDLDCALILEDDFAPEPILSASTLALWGETRNIGISSNSAGWARMPSPACG